MSDTALICLPEGILNSVPCRMDTRPGNQLVEVVMDPFGPGPLFRARTWTVQRRTSTFLYLTRPGCQNIPRKDYSMSCRHGSYQFYPDARTAFELNRDNIDRILQSLWRKLCRPAFVLDAKDGPTPDPGGPGGTRLDR